MPYATEYVNIFTTKEPQRTQKEYSKNTKGTQRNTKVKGSSFFVNFVIFVARIDTAPDFFFSSTKKKFRTRIHITQKKYLTLLAIVVILYKQQINIKQLLLTN